MKKEQQTDELNENESNESHSFLDQLKKHLLRAWLPVPTLPKTITLFFALSFIFFAIGIPMIVLSNQIQQIRTRYDDVCNINTNCTLTFDIAQTMTAPVFVYYQLNNFYQNHRLYAGSISEEQLRGTQQTLSEISTICSPITTNANLYVNKSIDGTDLDPNQPANPCGIIAYSIFNDTFSVFYPNGTNISSMTTNGIAWPSDQEKYKITNSSQQWLNVTDPRFMNWVRIASLKDFRKLWARINNDLSPGTYSVQISNLYDVQRFGTSKYFVMSTSNFFGSKNKFISIMYLLLGSVCFLTAIFFLIRLKRGKKSKK